MRNLFSLGLFALVLGTGCGEKAGGAATLTWKQGDEWHLATQRRVANVKETARHVELDGSATADEVFDENWTDEVVWTYQVVEAAVVPAEGDELYEYAVQYDGTVGELTVVRAWIDGSLNDDSEMIESDPVIYLVFNDRNRLGGAPPPPHPGPRPELGSPHPVRPRLGPDLPRPLGQRRRERRAHPRERQHRGRRAHRRRR
jgi:hypothetical protein